MKVLSTVIVLLTMVPSVHGSGIVADDCEGDKCTVDDSDLGDFLDEATIDLKVLGHTTHFQNVGHRPGAGGASGRKKAWHGVLGDASMTLIQESGPDNQRQVFGSVQDEKFVHHIAPDDQGKQRITSKPISEFPPEAEGRIISPANRARRVRARDSPGIRHLSQGKSVIDVMVVWTKLSECLNSFAGRGCTPTAQTEKNMRGLIDLAIDETNTAYDDSNINAELRLVHAYRQENFVEKDFGHALDSITYGEGVMKDVPSIRENKGADAVMFLIHDDDYCGMGWLGPDKDFMYAAVAWNCATGYYSFGHELAHNMGCNHDRGTNDECSVRGNNFGYRDPNANFRTIMSYDCNSGQCDRNRGGGCPRINRYSNTAYTYNGKVSGDSRHDNAAHINSVVAEIAEYYPTRVVDQTDEAEEAPKINIPINLNTSDKCEDDPTWKTYRKKKDDYKGCGWVGRAKTLKAKTKRCGKKSEDGVHAKVACPSACFSECTAEQ